MNPCNSKTNISDLRAIARTRLSVSANVANKMSRNEVCAAFKTCSATDLPLPPMKSQIVANGKLKIMFSKYSPLSGKELYLVL